MTSRILTALLLLALAAPAGAEPAPIHDGDRVTGVLPAAGSEVGLVLEALEGTILDLEAEAGEGAILEPEILVYGPDDVRIPAGPSYRHATGSRKARVRALVLAATGIHTIVLRAAGASAGAYRLRVRADHPRRVEDSSVIAVAGAMDHLRFPAFAGTEARFVVKGRGGLIPVVDVLLEPGLRERPLVGVGAAGRVVRGSAFACPDPGDYRLVVGGREGSTGAWRGRVKLRHPAEDAVRTVVDGEPAGTFTSGMTEPPPVPGPGPGPGPLAWRVLEAGSFSAITTPRKVVARTQAEYVAMWADHRPPWPPGIGAPDIAPPAVDFPREMVVAVFLGQRSWLTTVSAISVSPQGDGLQVVTMEVAGAGVVICYPYVLLAVTRVEGPVSFIESLAGG